MGGDKIMFATASALMLNEVCTTLNIPLEILGFTDGHNYKAASIVPIMYVFKEFKDLHVPKDDLLDYFAKATGHMTGNPDGENILWSYNRLLARKERKRCLVAMSDGQPAASKGLDGIDTYTLKVIQEIEALKKVDIYGLGLCTSAVTEYYTNHSVVEDASEIPHKLLELFERKILS
jgi:cobalamin biosynthesis protein CobT